MTIVEFGESVRAALSNYLEPAIVEFRGSLANGMFDEFSDVDLRARVFVPLDAGFFASREASCRVYTGLHSSATIPTTVISR